MVKVVPAVLAAASIFLNLSPVEGSRIDARYNDECANPEVRKEWRTLSEEEQAAYIDAIKVR